MIIGYIIRRQSLRRLLYNWWLLEPKVLMVVVIVGVIVVIIGVNVVIVGVVVYVVKLEVLVKLWRGLWWWWFLIILRVTLLSVENYDCGRLLVFWFIVIILLKTTVVSLFVMSVKVVARSEI